MDGCRTQTADGLKPQGRLPIPGASPLPCVCVSTGPAETRAFVVKGCGPRDALVRHDPAMRIAVLCDIHGNLPALEAVLAEVELLDVDAIVVGGDVVPGPFMAETVDRLRGLGDRARFV